MTANLLKRSSGVVHAASIVDKTIPVCAPPSASGRDPVSGSFRHERTWSLVTCTECEDQLGS